MQLSRRELIGALAALPAVSSARAAAPSGYPARDYDRAIVIDGLGGLVDPYGKEGDPRFSARGWAELRQSGVSAIHCTVNEVGNEPDVADKTLRNLAALEEVIADNPDMFVRATRVADIRAAKAAGKVALYYGFQDTSLIGADLSRIELYHGLGVRIIQLTYNKRNLSGDGAIEPANAGISDLGRRTIEAIEAQKILLDLSHGGQRTVAEAIAHAKRPPIISHSGCRALNDNPRNIWDAEMKALANKGGVFGIYYMPFLVANSKPTREDLLRHFDHALQICGEDHIAIGTDGMISRTVIDDSARAAQRKFHEERTKKGIAAPGEGPDIFNIVADYDTHLRFRMLADDLSARGWPAARIEKLLGGNLVRLYTEVWGG
ncbi:dipeptidase [Sphingomonas sp. QA11]|uniref:dipeptidase n=1 Tax=Sphingomonas sp. QA11 TaxID=2950605 RepID=UPI00234A6C4E|nr:membrane dipeptidase [Sphingomonas sp. QA11]WCM25196.1 dipeptidase [Sphingomonas sp. QA11]